MEQQEQTGWIPWPLDELTTMRDVVRWEEGKAACPAPWMVRVTWHLADGTATPVGVELRGAHGQAVTAEAWRTVRVREVIDTSRAIVRGWAVVGRVVATHGSAPDEQTAALARETSEAFQPPRKRGAPPKYDPAHYQRVADAYNAATDVLDPRPVRAVVREFGLDEDDPTDYRPKAWVRTARKRGLLNDDRRTQR